MFERLSALFGGGGKPADSETERALVADLVESVAEAVEPRVRMHGRYRQKIEPGVRKSIAYLRSIASEGLEPVVLSRAAWASDPRVNAFFAVAEDVRTCLGRSPELRSFLDRPENAALPEAYALLGMRKEERSVLGMDLKGDSVQREVAQVQINFSAHRIVAPGATLADTRLEAGRRIVMRLAQVALSRIIAADATATELQQHKEYLASRLRVLRLAKDGMEGLVKDPASIAQEMKQVEARLAKTVEGYIEAKAGSATLEGYLEQIDAVFSHPESHLGISRTPLRVSRLGVKVASDSLEAVNELALAELSIGEDWRAAIVLVVCPRGEVPTKEELIAQAERSL